MQTVEGHHGPQTEANLKKPYLHGDTAHRAAPTVYLSIYVRLKKTYLGNELASLWPPNFTDALSILMF